MISKVFPGHSFYHASQYVSNKPGSVLLEALGVRGYDPKLMAEDFVRQSELRPSKEQTCFHAVLSFYPGENPGDEKMLQIAKEYLEKLNIKNTQIAITKHTDKAHLHLHILANMIDNDGNSIKDNWIGLRGKKAAQELTQKYHLIVAQGKNLERTHLEALNESEANKYKIYEAIMENLPRCHTLKDLEERLLKQGISTQYKYKGQTNELQGISFKIGEDRFKGSKVDRKFSVGNLQKVLEYQRRQALDKHDITTEKTEPRHQMPSWNSSGSASGKSMSTNDQGLSKLLEQLLKPEYENGQAPYEFTEEYERRKKKKKGHGH